VAVSVWGVLGGRDFDLETIRGFLQTADFVVAADSGADTCLAAGRMPDIVVGDLDSISPHALSLVSDVRQDSDENRTDTDKLLALANSLGHREISLVGIEGDLPDHGLAILHSAGRAAVRARLVFRRGVGWVLRGPTEVDWSATIGTRVSLLPLADSEDVSLGGVRWPLRDETVAASGRTSISNEVAESRVSVAIALGLVFVFFAGDATISEP